MELVRGASFTPPAVDYRTVATAAQGLGANLEDFAAYRRMPFALEWVDETAVDLGFRLTLSDDCPPHVPLRRLPRMTGPVHPNRRKRRGDWRT